MRLFFVACAAFGMVLLTQFIMAQKIKIPTVSANQIHTLQNSEELSDRFVIVDVRDKAETDVSIIPGAITKSEFEKTSNQHQGKSIITYCTVGFRSGLYAKKLARQGWRSYNYQGSILDWCKNRLPLVTPDEKETKRVHTYSSRYAVADGYEAIYQ